MNLVQYPFELEEIPEKKIVCFEKTSYIGDENLSGFWRSFRQLVTSRISNVKTWYSVMLFPQGKTHRDLMGGLKYTRMAGIAWDEESTQLQGLEQESYVTKIYPLPAGKYAVFQFKGSMQSFGGFMQKVLMEVLPKQDLKFDYSRPQFEVLGPEYNPLQAENQEDVWIPVC